MAEIVSQVDCEWKKKCQISTLCKEGGRLLCGRAHFFFYYGTKRWSSQDENLRNVTVHMSSSKRVLYLSVEGQKISRGGRGKMVTRWEQKKIARRVTSLKKSQKEMNFAAFDYLYWRFVNAFACQLKTIYWKGNYQWYSSNNSIVADIKALLMNDK